MNTEKDFTTLANGGFTASLEAVFAEIVNYGNNGLPSMETEWDAWDAAVRQAETDMRCWMDDGAVGRFYIGDEWIKLAD